MARRGSCGNMGGMKTVVVAVAVLLAWASAARADAPDTVFLDELTWTEVRDAIQSGKTTIIVPTGGTEQNGPHMALGKHNVRVKALAEQIARGLGNALVAPVRGLRAGGRGRAAQRAHALPRHHHRARRRLPAGARVGGAELPRARLSSTSCSSAITARPRPARRPSRRRLNREWAPTRARVHAIDEYYKAGDRGVQAAPAGTRRRATTRSAATPGSRTPRSCWPSTRASSAPIACARDRARRRRRRGRRPQPGQRRARPARRGADRVARRRRDPAVARASDEPARRRRTPRTDTP